MENTFLSGAALESAVSAALCHLRADTPPSIPAIDRRLGLGYRVAAEVLRELQARGIVSAVQADGQRRYLGDGEAGREAFKRMAVELNAGIEPAAHWWRRLSPAKRRKYLPGINETAQWADLSASDMARARSIYWRNKERLKALCVEFDVRGVAA